VILLPHAALTNSAIAAMRFDLSLDCLGRRRLGSVIDALAPKIGLCVAGIPESDLKISAFPTITSAVSGGRDQWIIEKTSPMRSSARDERRPCSIS